MISMGNNAHPLHTDKMHFCTFPGHNNELRVYNSVGVMCLIWYTAVSPKVSSEVHYSFHVLQDEHEITLEELYTRLETNPDEVHIIFICMLCMLHGVHSSTSTISYTLQYGY